MYKIIQETPKIVLKSYIIEKFKPFLDIYEEEIKELIKFQYIKSIYKDEDYLQLQHNTELMNKWMEKNPKDAKNFLRFKDGYEASRESK